jgi:hypothetical protein
VIGEILHEQPGDAGDNARTSFAGFFMKPEKK